MKFSYLKRHFFSTTTWVHNSKSFFISFYTKTINHVQRQVAPVVQRDHHGIIAKALQNNKKPDSLILSWHFRCNSRRTLKSLEAMRRRAEYTDILCKTNWGIKALTKRLKHQLFLAVQFPWGSGIEWSKDGGHIKRFWLSYKSGTQIRFVGSRNWLSEKWPMGKKRTTE